MSRKTKLDAILNHFEVTAACAVYVVHIAKELVFYKVGCEVQAWCTRWPPPSQHHNRSGNACRRWTHMFTNKRTFECFFVAQRIFADR